MKRIISLSLLAAVIMTSCTKNDLNEDEIWQAKIPGYALVRVMHSYNSVAPYPSQPNPASGPRVDFFVNNVKVNGPALSWGNFFPNVSGGGAFSQVPSGDVSIKVVLNRPTGGGLPSDTIARGNFLLGPNVSHSIVFVDTLPNPTPYNPTILVLQEAVSMPAYGKFKIRFMNMIATNDLYEIYNSTTATVLTAPVPYKNVSDWVELSSFNPTHIYQLRVVGTTAAVASTTSTAVYSNLRSYTFWARGGSAGRARTLTTMITQ